MKTQKLNINKPNDAWILHREEIDTTQEGNCNIYVLLDAYSGFCFGTESSIDLPESLKIIQLLNLAHYKSGAWPKQVLILKKDPYVEIFEVICSGLKLPLNNLPAKDLIPFTKPFTDSFKQFKRKEEYGEMEEDIPMEQAKALVPGTYDPCACASGKKFKFCCHKAYKDIIFAMCAAQDGHLEAALRHINEAEAKIGRTAEIVCRQAICWSFYDKKKCHEYLREAIKLNPNHPRLNYILGIEARDARDYQLAVKHYLKAIECYPVEDKFHLNETYNNLGSAYFELKNYAEAKIAWEKALVLMPVDRMVRNNLFECIYDNPDLPADIRKIGPFIEKYLRGRGEMV